MTEVEKSSLIPLIDRLAADQGLLTAAAEAALGPGSPARKLPEAEVERHIAVMLDAVGASLAGDVARAERSTAAAQHLAVDRVEQGISLPVLLNGVLAARKVVLQALITQGAESLPPDELLPLLPRFDEIVGRLQNSMVLAYRTAETQLGRTTRARQADALRHLLETGEGAWAAEAGLDPSREYRCLVVDVTVPSEARRLEAPLESPDGISVLIHGVLCAIRADLPTGYRSPVLMVHSPPVPLSELPPVYLLCREALTKHRQNGDQGPHALLDSAVEIALGKSRSLGTLLSRQLLAGLDRSDERHRDIVDTLLTYLAVGSRLAPTAELLHVHPNTVKSRLRRFHELSERAGNTTSPALRTGTLTHTIQLWWALCSWRAE
ncbi:helix-turn-helix domain-containing protein [Cryptosporangium minutisporangium]|uniref:Helix-turn-helix domain-containing protein n=1 Tax=Cryptosporangium minutisporangium TaxID=113569 RepID=A0ABP6SRT8_9ACTN